jgi:pimeloyl-ACP methyl ester carboxylesterase
MKPLFVFIVSSILMQVQVSAQNREDTLATQFIQWNHEEKFTEACGMFAPSLAAAVSPEALKQVWDGLEGQYGVFKAIEKKSRISLDTITVIQTLCGFAKATVTVNLSFDRQDYLIGYRVAAVNPRISETRNDSSGFKQEAAVLHTTRGSIFGTLMFPNHQGAVPVALIIVGSGAVDRNGNSLPVEHSDMYKLLAEGLATNGIASLRYDKRGIGQSAAALGDERNLTVNDYVSDAGGWIRFLKGDHRFSGIIVIGHSEGSLIGMMAANSSHPDGFVSISGMGIPLDSILLIQLRTKLNDTLYEQCRNILWQLRQGNPVSRVPGPLLPLFSPAVQPYLISEINISPVKEIAKLQIPVLVVQGNNDVQISLIDARKLASACSHAKLLIVDHMTHTLKDAGKGNAENMKSYTDPSLPMDLVLISGLVNFIATLPDKR